MEVTAERLRVVGELPPVTLPRLSSAESASFPSRTRPLFLDGAHVIASVYQCDDLRYGQTLAGPSIVEQEDTTTIILPGWSAAVDAMGNLLITRPQREDCETSP